MKRIAAAALFLMLIPATAQAQRRQLSPQVKEFMEWLNPRARPLGGSALTIARSMQRPGYFDEGERLEHFLAAADLARYAETKSRVDAMRRRYPEMHNLALVIVVQDFAVKRDRWIMPFLKQESSRLLADAQRNRSRNREYALEKARAHQLLVRAMLSLKNEKGIEQRLKRGDQLLQRLARGRFSNSFHAERAKTVVFSTGARVLGRERAAEKTWWAGHGPLHAQIYLERRVRDIIGPTRSVSLDLRISVNRRRPTVVTIPVSVRDLANTMFDLRFLTRSGDPQPNVSERVAPLLAAAGTGSHQLDVTATIRDNRSGNRRDVGKGRIGFELNQSAIQRLRRFREAPNPGRGRAADDGGNRGGNDGRGSGSGPGRRPGMAERGGGRKVSGPPRLSRLPPEGYGEQGLAQALFRAAASRFRKRPMKVGVIKRPQTTRRGADQIRKIEVWIVWPDDDGDGLARVDSHRFRQTRRNNRWVNAEYEARFPGGPRGLIATRLVNR